MFRSAVLLALAVGLMGLPLGAQAPDHGPDPAAAPLTERRPPQGRVTTYMVDAGHTGRSPDVLVPPLKRRWATRLNAYPLLVGGGRVFTLIQPEDREVAVALDLRTGEELWRKQLPTAHATMTLDRGRLVLLTIKGLLMSRDVSDGRLLWSRDMSTGSAWTFWDAPTARGGAIYLTGGGINATLWKVDGRSGERRWARSVKGSGATPMVSGGRVFVEFSGPQTYAFTISGGLVWHRGGFAHGGGSSAMSSDGGRVFSLGRTGRVIDADNGRLRDAFFSLLPVALDEGLVMTNEYGVLHAVRRSDLSHLWTRRLPEGEFTSSGVISGGVLYVGDTEGTLHAVSLHDGRDLWHDDQTCDDAIWVTVGQGRVLTTCSGWVTAYGP